jgi:hypothetical protein
MKIGVKCRGCGTSRGTSRDICPNPECDKNKPVQVAHMAAGNRKPIAAMKQHYIHGANDAGVAAGKADRRNRR